MFTRKTLIVIASIVILGGLFGYVLADDQSQWNWVPSGGATLLLDTVKNCTNCDDIVTILTSQKTHDDWKAYFEGKDSTRTNDDSKKQVGVGAFKGLTQSQINTILDYATINLPVDKSKLPSDPAKIDTSVLPMQGKDLLLAYCMSCHSIAVPVTEVRDLPGWTAIITDSVHSGATKANSLTDQQVQELIHYLSDNMPVPTDQIPPEYQQRPPGY